MKYYTYIIESQKYYKIGKSKDIEQRLKSFDTQNPCFKLIKVINGDIEKFLHLTFANKRYKLEWFKLNKNDLNLIDQIIINHELSSINFSQNWSSTGELKMLYPTQHNRSRKVRQIDPDGVIIGEWNSIKEASIATGYKLSTLHSVTKNNKNHKNYSWVYSD